MSGAYARRRLDGEFRQVLLRLPAEMVEHLDRAADAGFRSRTSEVIKRLEESMVGESFDEHGVIVRQSQPSGNGVGEQQPGSQP